MRRLRAEDDTTRSEDALISLAKLVDRTQEGPDMLLLCHAVRSRGAIPLICGFVAHPTARIHQTSLMLLANFTALAIDFHAAMSSESPPAAKTKPPSQSHR